MSRPFPEEPVQAAEGKSAGTPGQRRTVAVLFSTPQAREVAQALLEQMIRAHAVIFAPKDLATDEWTKQATRYCSGWSSWYLDEHTLARHSIEILATTDELCVIANEERPPSGFDLKLSEGAENLLWLALDLGVQARYFTVNQGELANPETCLKERGVPERVAANKAQRANFTRQLAEIRLGCDFYSSGLWNARGQMLGYDLLDLPFSLVKRIAAWQRDYDDTFDPPDMGDEAWWETHNQEKHVIAKELQAALGSDIPVKLYRTEGWVAVGQIDRPDDHACSEPLRFCDHIISGGQTGVDRAALDFAIEYGYTHGGWAPCGRQTEDGVIPLKYQLTELADGGYRQRNKRSVLDSDGTLIINLGALDGGTLATQRFSQRLGKPCLHVQLDAVPVQRTATDILGWIRQHSISSLNVAGPRESKRPGIYRLTYELLELVDAATHQEKGVIDSTDEAMRLSENRDD